MDWICARMVDNLNVHRIINKWCGFEHGCWRVVVRELHRWLLGKGLVNLAWMDVVDWDWNWGLNKFGIKVLRGLISRLNWTSSYLQLMLSCQFHLLGEASDLEILQVDYGLFIGKEPLKDFSATGPELCINLTHIFNGQSEQLTVAILSKFGQSLL